MTDPACQLTDTETSPKKSPSERNRLPRFRDQITRMVGCA